jgi:hypothetical protein
MTLSEIRAKMKNLLGTPLPSIVRNTTLATENANLLLYINNAIAELTYTVEGKRHSETVALSEDTRTYSRPTGFLAAESVRYVDSDGYEHKLAFTTLSRLPVDYRTTTGRPTHYYYDGALIGLYPVPGENQDGNDLRVYGYYESADLSADSDTPDLDAKTHLLIPILAAAMVLEAQSRAEAQSANSTLAADSVSQESRTKEYAFRGSDMRKHYNDMMLKILGPGM